MLLYLRSFHVIANLIWIGSILAVALLLAKGSTDARQRGAAAGLVYSRLAAPSFVLSFVLGVTLLLMEPTYYFKTTHFMHAKLPLALVVIGLHHALGARTRKVQEGSSTNTRPAVLWGVLLAVAALGSALLALLKPF